MLLLIGYGVYVLYSTGHWILGTILLLAMMEG